MTQEKAILEEENYNKEIGEAKSLDEVIKIMETKKQAREKALKLLDRVGIKDQATEETEKELTLLIKLHEKESALNSPEDGEVEITHKEMRELTQSFDKDVFKTPLSLELKNKIGVLIGNLSTGQATSQSINTIEDLVDILSADYDEEGQEFGDNLENLLKLRDTSLGLGANQNREICSKETQDKSIEDIKDHDIYIVLPEKSKLTIEREIKEIKKQISDSNKAIAVRNETVASKELINDFEKELNEKLKERTILNIGMDTPFRVIFGDKPELLGLMAERFGNDFADLKPVLGGSNEWLCPITNDMVNKIFNRKYRKPQEAGFMKGERPPPSSSDSITPPSFFNGNSKVFTDSGTKEFIVFLKERESTNESTTEQIIEDDIRKTISTIQQRELDELKENKLFNTLGSGVEKITEYIKANNYEELNKEYKKLLEFAKLPAYQTDLIEEKIKESIKKEGISFTKYTKETKIKEGENTLSSNKAVLELDSGEGHENRFKTTVRYLLEPNNVFSSKESFYRSRRSISYLKDSEEQGFFDEDITNYIGTVFDTLPYDSVNDHQENPVENVEEEAWTERDNPTKIHDLLKDIPISQISLIMSQPLSSSEEISDSPRYKALALAIKENFGEKTSTAKIKYLERKIRPHFYAIGDLPKISEYQYSETDKDDRRWIESLEKNEIIQTSDQSSKNMAAIKSTPMSEWTEETFNFIKKHEHILLKGAKPAGTNGSKLIEKILFARKTVEIASEMKNKDFDFEHPISSVIGLKDTQSILNEQSAEIDKKQPRKKDSSNRQRTKLSTSTSRKSQANNLKTSLNVDLGIGIDSMLNSGRNFGVVDIVKAATDGGKFVFSDSKGSFLLKQISKTINAQSPKDVLSNKSAHSGLFKGFGTLLAGYLSKESLDEIQKQKDNQLSEVKETLKSLNKNANIVNLTECQDLGIIKPSSGENFSIAGSNSYSENIRYQPKYKEIKNTDHEDVTKDFKAALSPHFINSQGEIHTYLDDDLHDTIKSYIDEETENRKNLRKSIVLSDLKSLKQRIAKSTTNPRVLLTEMKEFYELIKNNNLFTTREIEKIEMEFHDKSKEELSDKNTSWKTKNFIAKLEERNKNYTEDQSKFFIFYQGSEEVKSINVTTPLGHTKHLKLLDENGEEITDNEKIGEIANAVSGHDLSRNVSKYLKLEKDGSLKINDGDEVFIHHFTQIIEFLDNQKIQPEELYNTISGEGQLKLLIEVFESKNIALNEKTKNEHKRALNKKLDNFNKDQKVPEVDKSLNETINTQLVKEIEANKEEIKAANPNNLILKLIEDDPDNFLINLDNLLQQGDIEATDSFYEILTIVEPNKINEEKIPEIEDYIRTQEEKFEEAEYPQEMLSLIENGNINDLLVYLETLTDPAQSITKPITNKDFDLMYEIIDKVSGIIIPSNEQQDNRTSESTKDIDSPLEELMEDLKNEERPGKISSKNLEEESEEIINKIKDAIEGSSPDMSPKKIKEILKKSGLLTDNMIKQLLEDSSFKSQQVSQTKGQTKEQK